MVKFKAVGGTPYMNWDLRLNSIQHGTTYQGLGAGERTVKGRTRLRQGLCMATRGRWSDLLVDSGNRRDPMLE